MDDYKLFAKRIGLIGLTNLLISLSGIILLPILTKNLSIQEYGIWAQAMVTISLIPSIAMLGLPYTMVRFLPSIDKKEEMQEAFYSICLLVLIVSGILTILIYASSKTLALALFGNQIAIVKILALIVFLECFNNLFLNYLRAEQKIKKYSYISIVKISSQVILVSYLVLIGKNIEGAVIGVLLSVLVIFLLLTLIIIMDIGFKFPKLTNIKEYLAFGLPTVPGNISTWIVNSSDRYVIGLFLGAAYVGYYSPGYSLGAIIGIFLAPFSFLLPAILSKHYDREELDVVRTILEYSHKYFIAIAIPATFGISVLSKPLLTILSTPEIASQSYLITPFVALSTFLFGLYTISFQVIVLGKKTKTIGKIWIIAAIVNLGLNFILIPYIGILGAALTTLIAFVLGLVITAHYSSKILRFEMNLNFIYKSIFASIVISLLIFLIEPVKIYEIILTIGICVAVYFSILLLLHGFDKKEISFFRNIVGS